MENHDHHDDCYYTMKVGDMLPEMTLTAYDPKKDETVKIATADYQEKGKKKGKWMVLVFYPADFTFICPTELEEMAGLYAEFVKLGAEVLSVSCDTAFVHKAWHDASATIRKIKFPMIADPVREICKAYGTLIEGEGLSYRATFIIDPNGIIKWFEIHDNSIGRSSKEILRKVKAAKLRDSALRQGGIRS